MRYPENSKMQIQFCWYKCEHSVQCHTLFSVLMVHSSFMPVWFHHMYHILDILGSNLSRKLIVKCRIFQQRKQDVLILLYREELLYIPQILVDCKHTRQILCFEISATVLFFFPLFATFLPVALSPAPQHPIISQLSLWSYRPTYIWILMKLSSALRRVHSTFVQFPVHLGGLTPHGQKSTYQIMAV